MQLHISREEAEKISTSGVFKVKLIAEKKLKRSKAKKKGKSIEELIWFVSYCEEITDEFSFEDILKGKRAQSAQERAKWTTKEKVDDIVSRTKASLGAGMLGASASVELEAVPQILRDEIHASVLKEEAECARVEALSPEEREKELQDIFGALRGPGFIEL
jgi:hypothetical protein